MLLAVPLDLHFTIRTILNDGMVQSNWCNWMTIDE